MWAKVFESQHFTFLLSTTHRSFSLVLSALVLRTCIFWMGAQNYIIRLLLKRSRKNGGINEIASQQQQLIEDTKKTSSNGDSAFGKFIIISWFGGRWRSQIKAKIFCAMRVCVCFGDCEWKFVFVCSFCLLFVVNSTWVCGIKFLVSILVYLFTKVSFPFELNVKF